MCQRHQDIIGYCGYCKGSISNDEPYSVEGKKFFHDECLIQMNTYDDSMDCLDEDSCDEVDPDLKNHEADPSDS